MRSLPSQFFPRTQTPGASPPFNQVPAAIWRLGCSPSRPIIFYPKCCFPPPQDDCRKLETELRDYKARAHALLKSKENELKSARDIVRCAKTSGCSEATRVGLGFSSAHRQFDVWGAAAKDGAPWSVSPAQAGE